MKVIQSLFQIILLMVMSVYLKMPTIIYHLDNYRDAKNESGIPYNDKKLRIKWKTKKPILHER